MPARFVVRLTASFRRDLEHLPAVAQAKVLEAIKRLGTKGVGQYRLEAWLYRVRDDVVGHEVILYRVRRRKDVHRGLRYAMATST